MKTFPTNFATEKNKQTGASPVWILKCPFPNTGTIYLSDQPFSVSSWNGGITTKDWVKNWGQIDENISGSEIAASIVSDFNITAIIDPNTTPDINTILWTALNNVETIDCELYLWFIGLDPATNPPQKMWVGNIIDFEKTDELTCQISLVDQSVKLDKYIGTVIDATTYPNADPDEIGKIANILYGAAKEVRCHAVKAGAVDTITADITATSPGNGGTLILSDASEFPAAGAFTIQFDYEQVRIASRSGNTLTLVSSGARGYGGTTATAHNKGAAVLEVLTEFFYLIADHPVKSIGDVFVDGLRVIGGYTVYTGQSGSAHANYPGKAVLVFSVKPTIIKQVRLDVSTGSHLHSTGGITTLISVPISAAYSEQDTYNNISQSGVVSSVRDSDESTSFRIYTPTGLVTRDDWAKVVAGISYGGPPARAVFICVKHKSVFTGTYPEAGRVSLGGNLLIADGAERIQKFNVGTAVPSSFEFKIHFVHAFYTVAIAFDCYIYEMWLEIQTDQTASSPADGVSLTGASVADTVIGSEVVAIVDGYKDDASGTYTGTPNTLIDRPNHIIAHFLHVYAGVALADFSTTANSYFSANSYYFSIVINERKKLKEWLADMAWQCRCYFRFAAGKAILTLRPDSLTTQKSITANMIRMQEDYKTTLRVARSPLEEIINKIKVYYNRDWLKTGEDAYTAISSASDTTSITRYGEKENPDLFFFDFVTAQAMADHVRDFYLSRYKSRKKVLNIELFLDNAELEFADNITITPQASLLGEVQKVNIYPGSGMDMRNDRINLIVNEY